MPQYAELAIGDEIAHRTGGMEQYQMIFGGAIPGEDGRFGVQVGLYKAAGYGGMGASFTWNVGEGDRIRLGQGYKVYEDPDRKKRASRVEAITFHKIEVDCVTVSYDWI